MLAQCVYVMKRILLIIAALGLCGVSVTYAGISADSLCARPKVALVLSGGGARGAAHVGVIRLIEEMHLPIDYVVGTSMGAIVGALYAIGYTADDMDSLMMVQDWKTLLSNDISRVQQPYAQRVARKRYQVNIPFEKGVFTDNSALYRDAGIKVRRTSLQTFPKVLSLPGLIDGHNLMGKFVQLTSPYTDSVSYDAFPHAFACVATDLVTGGEVVLDRGRLAESMRASMSIPGVFFPIYRGNQVLVDGGVVNNYPVNVARDMGADVIIGVEVNTSTIHAHELQSFSSIFERLIGTLGSDLHERNVVDTDILIRPRVKQFPVMGFDTLNLRQLIDIGYHTAVQSRVQLDSLKQRLACYSSDSVVRSTPPMPHGEPMVEESVKPSVSSNQVSIGLRFDSEDAAAVLLRIGIDRWRLSGMKLHLSTRLSVNPCAEACLSYTCEGFGQINASVRYGASDANRFYDKASYTLGYRLYGSDIYLSDLFSRDYDLRVGARYDYFSVHRLQRSDDGYYSYVDTDNHESYTTLYAQVRGDKYDAPYFPTRGYAYGAEMSYNIRNWSPDGTHFGAILGMFSTVVPCGRSTALLPSVYTRHLIGERVPLIYSNAMGGYLPHRYLRQQFPFVGFVGSEFMERHLAIARLELRQRLFADIYASGIVNYAYASASPFASSQCQDVWGMALQLSYDTTVGPLSISGHWSDLYHQFGIYFSLGFEF